MILQNYIEKIFYLEHTKNIPALFLELLRLYSLNPLFLPIIYI